MRVDESGLKRLVAFVVADANAGTLAQELRDHLRDRLPDYMVPAAFVALERFPLTPNGKIDRAALPEPTPIRRAKQLAVKPRDDLEEQIAEVWRGLLHVENVGIHDNFFDLGGHSLLSMQVIARLDKRFGIDLKPHEMVFQTLGQVASSCDEQMRGTRRSDGPALVRRLMGAVKATVLGGRGNVR